MIRYKIDVMAALKEAGYTFVPLSELIYRENYHMNHEGRQISDGGTWMS